MAEQWLPVSETPAGWTPVEEVGPHPEAKIGAPHPDAPVTLNDLRADPMGSMQRMGQMLGREASDPKTWLTLAAAYFGPKVFGMVAPTVAKAAAGAKNMATSGAARDLATVALGEGRVTAGLRLADRLRGAPEAQAAPVPPQSASGVDWSQSPNAVFDQIVAKQPAAAPQPPPADATQATPVVAKLPAPKFFNEVAIAAKRAQIKLNAAEEFALAKQAAAGGNPTELVEALAASKQPPAARLADMLSTPSDQAVEDALNARYARGQLKTPSARLAKEMK